MLTQSENSFEGLQGKTPGEPEGRHPALDALIF